MGIGFVVLLLVLTTMSQGAFAVSRWAPLGLLILGLLVGAVLARGRLAVPTRSVGVALISIWGLAVWSMLSMLWAQSPGDAFTSANTVVLYAAVVTVPFMLPMSRRNLALAGWTVVIGLGAVGLYTLVGLFVDGPSLFLAGRLNGPVNYRNATALLFAMPVWPLVIAAATKARRRGVRAIALGLGTMCLGLAFLTQSRGIVIGLLASAVVVLAAGPDRLRRAWVAIVSVGCVAVASPWLLRPYHAFNGGHGYVTGHDIEVAAIALALASAGAALAGLAIALFDNGLRPASPELRDMRRLALAVGCLVAVIAALATVGNPVTYARRKWDEFTSLQSTTSTSSRLLSTGGQRYDLWRVALKEFSGAPAGGVGAGNYAFDYYRYRRTNRNLTSPHSLLFALLSETGIVGLLLFVAFLGGLMATMTSRWKRMPAAARRSAIVPVAAGVAWVGQSTVDWFWLIPGLTAIALFTLSLGAAQAAAPETGTHAVPTRRARLPVRLGKALPLAVAAVSILALYLSDAYVQQARSVDNQPLSELSAARTASNLDPWSVTPQYLEASAYESMGQRHKAYGELANALKLDPQNFVTLGLLGDFEARGRNLPAARRYYRRALSLDPLDVGLQRLARFGLSRVRSHGRSELRSAAS